jgi:hypothetical protein
MGGSTDWYVRAPLPLVLVLGPLMGLLFFIALPLSGMVVLVPFVAGKVRTAVSSGRLSPVHLASRAEPGISYLEPHLRSGATTTQREDTESGKLLDLADRIAEKDRHQS